MALSGMAGFKLAGSEWLHATSSSISAGGAAGADSSFIPKIGVNAVVARPNPPGPLQLLPPGISSPATLFIYPSMESLLGKDFGNGATSESAWVYGAKLTSDEAGALPVLTGQPSDVLKGRLVSFPPMGFPSKLRLVDGLMNFGGLSTTLREMVPVVKKDGSTIDTYWYYQKPSPEWDIPAAICQANAGDEFTMSVEEAKRNLAELIAAYRQPIKINQAAAIGNTPMVQFSKIGGDNAIIFAKVEGRNPAYSVKCRLGAALVYDAEKRGTLKPGMTIVEPTSGNTGIALAFVAAAKGYKCILTMPESMSVERRRLMAMLGAELVLTEAPKGMKGAIAEAARIVATDPSKYFMAQQFENNANVAIHELTTGPEIWTQTAGKIDILVAGVGTGGTISGISRYLKNTKGKKIITIAVEPENSPVISQTMAGQEIKPGPHIIQGIGAGFIPGNLDISTIDRVEKVSNEDAMAMAKRLAKEEGLLVGISCGAAAAAAVKVANMPENKGKVIVVVLPDLGERYMSTPLYADLDSAVSKAPGLA
eukprot:gb/GEZN01004327.1/.p1 GENE.gb/GEZN01004327.1/~~gb/GEZN01004327.1/.p1  ORF type:complete len:568 (-),score=106.15 gb/GEZN01004327.1/:285-1895(-)